MNRVLDMERENPPPPPGYRKRGGTILIANVGADDELKHSSAYMDCAGEGMNDWIPFLVVSTNLSIDSTRWPLPRR
jgi:hypothetical protein